MSSESAALENLSAKIGSYLRETVGSYEFTLEGSYSLRRDSTRLIITHVCFADTDKTLVSILAFATINLNVNNDLMKYLMDVNKNIVFG